MADWAVPDGLEGVAGVLRVQASWARDGSRACPQFQAARARPGLWPAGDAPHWQPGLAMFALDPVMVLLDLVEYEELSLDRALKRMHDGKTKVVPHDGLLRWARHGAAGYLAAGEAIAEGRGSAARPASRPWVMQVAPPSGITYELRAWGRQYEGADGQDRELRVPRDRTVKDRAVDHGQAAAAALVLARGRVALSRPRRGEAYKLGSAEQVRRVRVVEVGCEDGSWQVMFDGTPEDARQQYDKHARDRLSAVTAGGEYRPGSDCAGCKLLDTCPVLQRRPGLLGVSGDAKPVRTWSVTNGRHYLECPAQEYLGRLRLPYVPVPASSAVARGQAVHAWLADRHARQPAVPCLPGDVPASAEAWSAGGWEVNGDDARLGVQMIGDHSLTCALRGVPPEARVLPEEQLVVYDAEARVLVIAKADLLYEVGGAWTLRETKTARTVAEASLLDRYPQMALGILLLAAGIPGGTRDRNRVELERLTPAGPLLDDLDLTDPELHAEARRVIGGMIRGWREDGTAATRPGPACRGCDASRWCPDAASTDAGEDPDD